MVPKIWAEKAVEGGLDPLKGHHRQRGQKGPEGARLWDL